MPAGSRLQVLEHLRHAPIVGIIPARYNSTRLPGKPLVDIDGHPMIEHVYRRAAAARSLDAVVVATDDERVQAAVARFGGLVCLTRSDHRSGTDRLAEVAQSLSSRLIVNIQGDEPLIEPDAIDEAVAPFATDPLLMMSTLRRLIEDAREAENPNVVKVVVDREGMALYFSRAPIPFHRADAARPPLFKHIGLYVYRREFLLQYAQLAPTALERAESLEQLRALEHGFRIKAIETRHDSIGVDSPEDLEGVRRLMAAGARVSHA